MPPLEHPKQQGPISGWNGNGKVDVAAPPHQHQPPAPPRGAFGAHDQAVLGHGGSPGEGVGDTAGLGDGGRGGGGVGGATVPWLQHHSFHSREGAYVSLKESLDNSQEVSGSEVQLYGVVLRAHTFADLRRAPIRSLGG